MSEMVWVVCHPHSWPNLSPDPTTDVRGAHCWTVAVGSGVKFDNGSEGVKADVLCTRNLARGLSLIAPSPKLDKLQASS